MDLRQGDYLPNVRAIFGSGATGSSPHTTELGVVVISQCCDLAKARTDNLPIAARVVRLDGNAAVEARAGRRPQYCECSHLGRDLFVDFGVIGGLELANDEDFFDGVSESSDEWRRALAARISRRFTRFAYPDAIQPYFRSIQLRLRKKSGRLTSPMGRCLERLVTLRIETDWSNGPPWAINVVFVLVDEYLPILDYSVDKSTTSFSQVARDLETAAQHVDSREPGDVELWRLWQRLADLLVVEGFESVGPGVISEVTAEITDESDFTYSRFRRSVDLDIDDLSEDELNVNCR